jgi:hypothetical protein
MPPRDTPWNVNILVVSAAALLIVLLTGVAKYFEPQGGYFSFSAFLYSYPEPLRPGAILVQVAIPLFVGAALPILPIQNARQSALSAGALGAFLVVWPVGYLWQELEIGISGLGPRRGAFVLVFGLYVVAEAFLCATGLRVALAYQQWARKRRAREPFSLAGALLDWKESIKPGLIALFTSILTLIVGRLFSE